MKLCLWSWLGVARQQAITRANVDQVLYRHMSSLNHNGLIEPYPSVNPYIETGYKKNAAYHQPNLVGNSESLYITGVSFAAPRSIVWLD